MAAGSRDGAGKFVESKGKNQRKSTKGGTSKQDQKKPKGINPKATNDEVRVALRARILRHARSIVDGVADKASEGHYQSAKMLFGMIGLSSIETAVDEGPDPFEAIMKQDFSKSVNESDVEPA